MLPNFLLIGVEKAATTWLAKCIGEHPNVFMADEKELHFFNYRYERGLAWYESHFNGWSGQAAIGEATPGYIYSPDAHRRIKAILGDQVKLIVTLRHPVDRAYSAFGQYMRQGRSPPAADFQKSLQEDVLHLRRRGCYAADLKRYLTFFPRENLSVLIFEEIKKDNLKSLINCFAFLGVTSQFIPESLNVRANKGTDLRLFHNRLIALRRYLAAKTELLPGKMRQPALEVGRWIYKNLILERLPKQTLYEPPNPELRQELLQDFMTDIRQLEDLLDRDFSIWYSLGPG
jgi:hypothetical protein